MGTGVKRYTFWGTKEEVQGVLAVIPHYAADRMIESVHPIYDHMNKHLGTEIYTATVSKQQFNDKTVNPIQAYAKKHPKLLWQIAWKNGKVIENGLERFSNFSEVDYDFPGPFGALCRLYGKSYWGKNPSEERHATS